jgi:tetratricopeptide (TPR) repeat protein
MPFPPSRPVRLLLLIAALSLPACADHSVERRAEARRLRDAGRPAEAAAILADLTRRSPEDAALVYEYAQALHLSGREDEALARVEAVLKKSPADAEAHVLHGTVLAALGREQEGLAELRQVAAAEPARAGVHRAMGLIHARAGRGAQAVNQFEKELALNPDDGATLTELGVYYLSTGQIEQAVDRLRRAASLGGAARAHRYLAEALFRQSKTEEGLEEQRAARRLSPDDVDLLVAHAHALQGYGHAAEARAVLQEAIDHGVRDARVYNEFGRQAREDLDYDRAIALFREAIAIDPGLADAQMNLAKTYLYQGQRDAARAAFEAARTAAPTDPYAYFYLGTLLADDQKYDEAIPLLRRSLELDPFNPKAHYALGQALQRVGSHDEAQAEFARHAEILKRLRDNRQSGTATME